MAPGLDGRVPRTGLESRGRIASDCARGPVGRGRRRQSGDGAGRPGSRPCRRPVKGQLSGSSRAASGSDPQVGDPGGRWEVASRDRAVARSNRYEPRPRNHPGNAESRTPGVRLNVLRAARLLKLAVTVGFEPTEACTSHAFELEDQAFAVMRMSSGLHFEHTFAARAPLATVRTPTYCNCERNCPRRRLTSEALRNRAAYLGGVPRSRPSQPSHNVGIPRCLSRPALQSPTSGRNCSEWWVCFQ
jgi:hypothetical protein